MNVSDDRSSFIDKACESSRALEQRLNRLNSREKVFQAFEVPGKHQLSAWIEHRTAPWLTLNLRRFDGAQYELPRQVRRHLVMAEAT